MRADMICASSGSQPETGAARLLRRLAMATALLAASGTSARSAPQPAPRPTIVLVHGALVDGSSWRDVYEVLTGDGYSVRIVQQPLTGLEDDVAATKRVLDQIDGPVILAGHSYGGAIITVAGIDPKVKALVYVAALQPDAGETTGQLAPPTAAAKDIRQTRDGFLYLDPAKFAEDFAADLPRREAEFMARSQMPVAGAAFSARLTAAAWHDKPSYAVIALQDRELDPDVAQRMAGRARSTVTLVRGSHAILISQARAVARVIETAARAAVR